MLSLIMVATSLVVIGSALYGGYQTVHCLVAWHIHGRNTYTIDTLVLSIMTVALAIIALPQLWSR